MQTLVSNFEEEKAGIIGVPADYSGFVHQYDGEAQHRLLIVRPDNPSGEKWLRGKWTTYTQLAFLKVPQGAIVQVTWMCATDYWKGTFEPDFAYLLKEPKLALVGYVPKPEPGGPGLVCR